MDNLMDMFAKMYASNPNRFLQALDVAHEEMVSEELKDEREHEIRENLLHDFNIHYFDAKYISQSLGIFNEKAYDNFTNELAKRLKFYEKNPLQFWLSRGRFKVFLLIYSFPIKEFYLLNYLWLVQFAPDIIMQHIILMVLYLGILIL